MNTLSYKTANANKETVTKEWVLIDAENEVLGRLASKVAYLLKGKHKVNYTPHVDCGDNVVIINADKIALNGNKWDTKEYIRHSGYPGGQTRIVAKDMMQKKPFAMVEKAVKGMLMKNKLGAQHFRNLYVYAGTEHPHQGQNPKPINLNEIL
jgi:large subunit ribosomal protein L13